MGKPHHILQTAKNWNKKTIFKDECQTEIISLSLHAFTITTAENVPLYDSTKRTGQRFNFGKKIKPRKNSFWREIKEP